MLPVPDITPSCVGILFVGCAVKRPGPAVGTAVHHVIVYTGIWVVHRYMYNKHTPHLGPHALVKGPPTGGKPACPVFNLFRK